MIAKVLCVASKELRHLIHDRIALALLVVLPLLQLIFYAYALDARVHGVATAVVNHDHHAAARQFVDQISRSDLFSIRTGYSSGADVEAAMRTGAIQIGVELPADYSASLLYGRNTAVQVWVDGSNPLVSNYVLAVIDGLGGEMLTSGPQFSRVAQIFANHVRVEPHVRFNVQGSKAVFLFPGLLVILVQTLLVILTALSISGERERGTLEQILITPLGPAAIIAGKCLTIALFGFIETVLMVAIIHFVFGLTIHAGIVVLGGFTTALVAGSIGLGLLTAAAVRTSWHVVQLAFLWTFVTVMLSGFLIPREMLTPAVAWISDLLPSTYFVAAATNIIVRGAGLAEFSRDLVTCAGAACGLALLGHLVLLRSLGRSR